MLATNENTATTKTGIVDLIGTLCGRGAGETFFLLNGSTTFNTTTIAIIDEDHGLSTEAARLASNRLTVSKINIA